MHRFGFRFGGFDSVGMVHGVVGYCCGGMFHVEHFSGGCVQSCNVSRETFVEMAKHLGAEE